MKSLERIIMEPMPTLAVFVHAGEQDEAEVNQLLDELRAKYGDRVHIERADASRSGEMKVSYKLKEYPTWILYKQGEELMRESGRKTFAELEDMLIRAL